MIKTGQLVSLSEQELVDCEKDNEGCNGGLMENAYEFIKKEGGITTERLYPYSAKDEKCDSSKVIKYIYSSPSNQLSIFSFIYCLVGFGFEDQCSCCDD